MLTGIMSAKSHFELSIFSEKGREHVSMAYKMMPHDQSSKANDSSGSSGGEYNAVPPITCVCVCVYVREKRESGEKKKEKKERKKGKKKREKERERERTSKCSPGLTM